MKLTKKSVNGLAYKIVGCAIEVHKELGAGLLESVYETCLADELKLQGLDVQTQVELPVQYKGRLLNANFRMDLVVENLIVVEVKSVAEWNEIFKAQLMTYVKLSGLPKGLLINFYTANITKSLIPIVDKVFAQLPEE